MVTAVCSTASSQSSSLQICEDCPQLAEPEGDTNLLGKSAIRQFLERLCLLEEGREGFSVGGDAARPVSPPPGVSSLVAGGQARALRPFAQCVLRLSCGRPQGFPQLLVLWKAG